MLQPILIHVKADVSVDFVKNDRFLWVKMYFDFQKLRDVRLKLDFFKWVKML